MIYFDNAATTLQKPQTVTRAVVNAMGTCGNPGRGGHRAAMEAAAVVYRCREEAARLFHLSDPTCIIFTQNATHALNIAIHTLAQPGTHGVISGYEHNSVVRPLESRKACQVAYTVASAKLFDPQDTVEQLRLAIRPDTGFVVCNHISNVFGFIQPVEAVDALCAEKGIPLILDLSQSAGVLDLDCSKLKSTVFCCMPGHKSLYGPQGTGILICLNGVKPNSITQGGTGSNSLDLNQPDFLPDMLESGTLNVHGLAGLAEGIAFVRHTGMTRIREHEDHLCRKTAEGLKTIRGVRVYTGAAQSGVLAFTAEGADPAAICERMGQAGICLRGGLHCAPLAHRSAGTLPAGAVRVSFSVFNSEREVQIFLRQMEQTMKTL